jgi:hypothetical protein
MNTHEYLCNHVAADYDRQETEWTLLASVAIGNGDAIVCDPSLYPNGVRARLLAGRYQVLVALVGYEGRFYVSRLRMLLPDSVPLHGKPLGEVSVEFGRVTIGQYGDIASAGAQMNPEDVDRFSRSLDGGRIAGMVEWGRLRTPYVECGDFGGGLYRVIELVQSGQIVGIEVDVLGDDRPDVLAPSSRG